MNPEKINLSEAKALLGRYVAEAATEARPIKLGLLEGQFEVPEDFTAPMPEFEAEIFGLSDALAVEEAARA